MPTSVMRYLLDTEIKENSTLLDVGCGPALCAEIAHENKGCEVTMIDLNDWTHGGPFLPGDLNDPRDFGTYLQMDFMDYTTINKPFDHVFCSHSFEHQLNPQTFLDKLVNHTKDNGLLTIIVPPFDYTDGIVIGHVNVFTPEVLLYRMVLAGLDCSEAKVFSFPGNIAVSVRKRSITLTEEEKGLNQVKKSLYNLARFFPPDVSWKSAPTHVMKVVNFTDRSKYKVGRWTYIE